jgi:hypothetical protein
MLLWRGSKALGLHPWHPEALRLLPLQLEWAAIQAGEDQGIGLRHSVRQQKETERRTLVGRLVAWADHHISRWRR